MGRLGSLTRVAISLAAGVGSTMLLGGAAPVGRAAQGQALFQDRCGLCHAAGPEDGDGGQGPTLKGVVGRRAGSVPGFGYTAALKASGRVWTLAALDHFLSDPSKDVPGTTMPVSTPDPQARADLIAYLATVK